MTIRRPKGDAAEEAQGQLLSKRSRIFLTILLAMSLLPSSIALAESGELFEWPVLQPNTKRVNAYSKRSGLHLSVDSRWSGDRGYRPVRFTLSSLKPIAADVQITVRFRAGYWQFRERSITQEQDFEMLQGNTSVTETMFVPQHCDWDRYGWEVWIDGKKDKDLTLEEMRFNRPNASDAIATALILPTKTSGINLAQSLQIYSSGMIEALSINDAQIPEKWFGYTNFDIVTTKPAEMEQWSRTSPEQFAEMLRWVRAGGNLWLFDVGSKYEKIAELDLTLGIESESNIDTSPASLDQRGWLALSLRESAKSGPDALIILDGRYKAETPEPLHSSSEEVSKLNSHAPDSRNRFVARAYGMGSIVAFQKPFKQIQSGDKSDLTAFEDTLLYERIFWNRRHGNYPGRENIDFNEFLIPDVGSAPVFEFQLLISLFVIGIGPLNYWLLKRRHQLPLLLLTVPLAALATTVILFAYGILSDGFSVRIRARSITLIDQEAGEATCWARTSYYAGLAPAKGLKMPDDMAIYPIAPVRSGSSNFGGRQSVRAERELEWGEHQNLTRGWLASRTPTQYLSIVARASNKRLVFESRQDRLAVANELGVDILWLAVQDHDGIIYVGDSIAVGGSSELEKSKTISAMSHLRTIINDNVPELPAGYLVSSKNQRSWRNSKIPEQYRLATNLMENQINSLISPLVEGWGNGSYIAITATGPELSLGVEDAIESDSFHVVRGSWSNE